MTTYTIKVVHGPRSRPLTGPAVPPGGSQEHEHLEADRAREGIQVFIDDLFRFHGNGVKSITITAEREEGGE
jgi:hypothetical protein